MGTEDIPQATRPNLKNWRERCKLSDLEYRIYEELRSGRDDRIGWEDWDMLTYYLDKGSSSEVNRALGHLRVLNLVEVTYVGGLRRWHRTDDCDPFLCKHAKVPEEDPDA